MRAESKNLQTLSFALLLVFSVSASTVAYHLIQSATVSFRNGERLWDQGRKDEALRAFREAADSGRLRPSMALALSRAAFTAGDEETGKAALSALIASNNKLTPDTLNSVAGMYDQYGMPGKALAVLSRSGDAVLRSRPTATYLAELKARSGDLPGAERLYREVLVQYPADAGASLGLAQLLAWSGRTREAENLCRPVLERDPGNRPARIVLGRVLTAAGRFEEAIAQYRKALEKAS